MNLYERDSFKGLVRSGLWDQMVFGAGRYNFIDLGCTVSCTLGKCQRGTVERVKRDITLCKKASNHHANLPLEMYSVTL